MFERVGDLPAPTGAEELAARQGGMVSSCGGSRRADGCRDATAQRATVGEPDLQNCPDLLRGVLEGGGAGNPPSRPEQRGCIVLTPEAG